MELTAHPHFKRTLKWTQRILFLFACSVIILFLLIISAYTIARIAGPPPLAVPQTTIFYGADGTVIGETSPTGKRYWVELDEISPDLINAVIAIEDQHFYSHIGFDVKRIFGAILADIKAMGKVQGASTITQQYAKNLFLTNEKTWSRKLKEAIYTIRLEANYSKEEILEGYLNTIYFGHGTYGVEAASRYYFQKSAGDLTLSEAALLAGIPKGPSYYSPFLSYENAKSRQELILSTMAKKGFISEEMASIASREELQLKGADVGTRKTIAPYFVDVVKNQLRNNLGLDERTIALGGLRVYTTLDPEMQAAAEEVIDATIDPNSQIQTALISMNPKNGFVRALVGGRDYEESSFNRATQAIRQPGSTIKPILYYAAIEKGFTPATTFRSEETTFSFDDGRAEYSPRNFNEKYADDDITLAQALALSDNVYAVKTHLFLGTDVLPEYMKKFGITSETQEIPSLALGTSGVKPIEMAKAYSMFANGGKTVEPVFITRVEDYNGEILYQNQFTSEQVLDPDATFLMTHLMTGIFDSRLNGYANVTGGNLVSKLTRDYAGKSGSTDTDSWMIGYTPQLVTAVWTGYDKGQRITRFTERGYAKHIWADFMEKALDDQPLMVFKPTEGVTGILVDPQSGLLASDSCPSERLTYFIKGTEPTEYCSGESPKQETAPEPKEPETKEEPWYRKWLDWVS